VVCSQAVASDGVVIVCTVSQPYLEFLNNWLISVARQERHQGALVIAEDYATLDFVNTRWPGHAVLIPPPLSATSSLRFGSQVSRYVGFRAKSLGLHAVLCNSLIASLFLMPFLGLRSNKRGVGVL
jgi:hypothetical protein